MAKKEKKNGKGGAIGALVAGIILLLSGGAWGTGLLPGSDGIGNGNDTPQKLEATKAPEENNKDDKTESIIITLEQVTLQINGKDCAFEDLDATLKSMISENKNITIEFKSANAVKSKYDEVTSELKKIEDYYNIHITGLD